MSIKGFRLLWIRIRTTNKRFIDIPFPIPLYLFQELLDCFLDLLSVICFFVPKEPDSNPSSRITIHSVKLFVIMLIKLIDSLGGEEPYDLVDVTTDQVQVLIRIR